MTENKWVTREKLCGKTLMSKNTGEQVLIWQISNIEEKKVQRFR